MWKLLRRRYISRLLKEAGQGVVDPDILTILVKLNSCKHIVTTSSCSGRIVLIAAPNPKDKYAGTIVAKWHRPIKFNEFIHAVNSSKSLGAKFVWVSVQPPILTLYTCSVGCARQIVRATSLAGFKYSCYATSANNFLHVRVIGTTRIDIPLFYKGEKLVNNYELIVDLLNEYIYFAKQSLERLKRILATLLATSCRAHEEYDEATLSRGLKPVKNTDLTESLAWTC